MGCAQNNGKLTAGRLVTITDPLSHITTNGYDALNRLIQVTDPANGITSTAYNALDQVTQVKDPRLVTTNYTIDALGNVTLTQSPDSGNTQKTFDAAGNLTQQTDARGVVSNYTYDALNRLKTISYPANTSENVSFTYDDTSAGNYRIGRLSSISANNGNSALIFSYDPYGNITLLADLTAQVWGTSQYQYASANRVKQISYPSGRIVTYTRNALGQIIQVQTQDSASAAQQTIISSATYEPFGPLKTLTYGNGVTTTFAHDLDYRVGRITTTSTPVWDYVYSYDASSNVQGMADQIGSATKTFGYDTLNRLITDNVGGVANLAYQYDAGGNRTQLNIGSYNLAQTYAANSNRLTSLWGTTLPSDANGNLTANLTASALGYNNANRLSQSVAGSTTTTYQYTGLGWRDGKFGAQRIHYDYLPDSKLLAQMQLNADNSYNTGTDYIWLDDMPIAQIKTVYTTNNTPSTRRLTYIHVDHLNTPRLMTDSTKKVVWTWNSDAYGLLQPNTNPDGDGVIDSLDLRMGGMIADSESGLYVAPYRGYDPNGGRFTQYDLIGVNRDLSNPILQMAIDTGLITPDTNDDSEVVDNSLNQPYAYVKGAPLSFVDPYGLWHYGPGAHGPVNPQTDAFLQCMDTCTHRDLCVTSANDGTHSGPNDPHFSGQAADVGKRSNPGLRRNEVEQCYRQCSAQDPLHNYGQEEGNHFHFQTRPGRGGAHGFAGGVH